MDEKRKRKCLLIVVIALLVAFLAVMMAQNAQDTADINNVFEIAVNNTDLAPGMGTGERVAGTIYYANNSPIQLMVLSHASLVGDTATVEVFINGTMVQNQSGRPLAGAEQTYRSVAVVVPKFANYTAHFHNVHHYEWREYPILSGKNGTLSINQTVLGNSFNATYDSTTKEYNSNYSSQTFPNATIISANNSMNSMKVNKTGDNMTGRLCFNNCSQALNGELLVIQKSGNAANQGAFIRLESNNTVLGNAFFGARYRGDRADNQTPVLKNDVLFHLGGIGTKVNNTFSGFTSELRFIAEDNFTNTKTPGRIEFWTVNNITTTSNTKKWEIAANGSLIPANNNLFDIGNDTSKVKNMSIALTAEGVTLDAVCYDGTKLFYNPGIATCTASRAIAKNNITDASYDPLKLKQFQLITYDYVVKYPHVIEAEDRVEYTEKTVKRYGLTAEAVEAIDPLLVGHDEFGNPTGIHYEDLAAYLLNVTQAQQIKIDMICTRQPALCQ